MIVRERYQIVPVVGTVQWNTVSDIRGNMAQLIVNPSVPTTNYDVYVTDDEGTVVYRKNNVTGTLIEDKEVALYGIYTINLSNCSTNTYSFTVTLLWNERVAV